MKFFFFQRFLISKTQQLKTLWNFLESPIHSHDPQPISYWSPNFEPAKKTPRSSSFVNRRHFPILFYNRPKTDRETQWNDRATMGQNPCLWTLVYTHDTSQREEIKRVDSTSSLYFYYGTKIVYVAPLCAIQNGNRATILLSSSFLSLFLSPSSFLTLRPFFSTRRLRVFRYGLNLIRRYRGSLYFYTKSSGVSGVKKRDTVAGVENFNPSPRTVGIFFPDFEIFLEILWDCFFFFGIRGISRMFFKHRADCYLLVRNFHTEQSLFVIWQKFIFKYWW